MTSKRQMGEIKKASIIINTPSEERSHSKHKRYGQSERYRERWREGEREREREGRESERAGEREKGRGPRRH